MLFAQNCFDAFFDWYNHQHHHINLALFTPAQVHQGTYQQIQVIRQAALDSAYLEHPERFVKGPPKAPTLPALVAINPESFILDLAEKPPDLVPLTS